MSTPHEADGLLGTDFLDWTSAEINFVCGNFSLAGNFKAPPAFNGMSADRATLTVYLEHEMCRKPQLALSLEPHLDKQSLGNPYSAETTQWCRSWLVRANKNVTLALRCSHVVRARKKKKKGRSSCRWSVWNLRSYPCREFFQPAYYRVLEPVYTRHHSQVAHW
jgi:hypothetical protein